MAPQKLRRPTIFVVGPLPDSPPGVPMPVSLGVGDFDRVEIGGGVRVPREFFADFDLTGAGRVELTIEAEAGRVRAVGVVVTEAAQGAGVSGLSLDGVPIQSLLEQATAYIAATASGTNDTFGAAGAATRRRVSDERLTRVAEMARSGGVESVQASEHVGRRQAFRLIARAKADGLDVGGDDR